MGLILWRVTWFDAPEEDSIEEGLTIVEEVEGEEEKKDDWDAKNRWLLEEVRKFLLIRCFVLSAMNRRITAKLSGTQQNYLYWLQKFGKQI